MKIPLPDSLKSGFKLDKDKLKQILLGTKPKGPAGPETYLAVDFGRSKIVFLEITRFDQVVTLQKFKKTDRPAEKGKDSEVLKAAFAAGAYSTSKVRISVKGQGVILRFIQFPQMKLEELRSAITYEIEQYIPFKAAEVVWDFQILEENVPTQAGGNVMNILLVAVKRDDLYHLIETFKGAGLEIEVIDVDALAAINALEYFHPEKFNSPNAILDIGSDVSTLSIILNGKPRFIRDVSYGGADIIKKLKRKAGLTHDQAAEQVQVDRAPTPEAQAVLKEALGDLVSELKLSLSYYLDQVPSAEPVKTLSICGGGGYHPTVIETLTEDLGFKVEMMDILSKVQLGPGVEKEVVQANAGLMPIAFGLCLRGQI